MKAKLRIRTGALCISSVFSVFLASRLGGQTLLNLATQTRNADFTNFPYTRPVKTGSTLPSTCTIGDLYLNITATAGRNLYVCLSSNSWVQQGGLSDPGTNGIVVRSGSSTTVIAAPASALVGINDAQILTNKSLDGSEITSGVIPASRIPSLTGDVTTASGSTLTTLATVNNTPGTFGDATHSVQVTVDSKGRVTALGQIAITGSGTTAAFPTTTGLLKGNGSGSATVATGFDVVNLFGSGSCSGYLKSDLSCGSPSSSISSGTTASMPASGPAGQLYNVTDSSSGLPFYFFNASGSAVKLLDAGPSGALNMSTQGQIDINTSVVPRLAAANTFTGSNSFGGTTTLNNVTISGTCTGCTGSGIVNPMTALGDLIAGGTSGAATRLGIGAAGQVLTVSSGGQPVWQAPINTYSQLSTDTNGNITVTGNADGAADLTVLGANASNIRLQSHDGVSQWFISAYPAAYTSVAGDMAFYNAQNGKSPLRIGTEGNYILLNGDTHTNRPPCDARHRGAFFFQQDSATTNQNDGVQVCAYVAGTLTWKVVF